MPIHTESTHIPKGWVETTLGEVIASGDFQIKNNLREPIASNIRAQKQWIYAYYGAASAIDFIDDYKIDWFHLLIAEDGTVTSNGISPMLQLVDGKFNVSNHAHILQGKEKWKTKFLFYLLSNLNINPYITGAVQPKLNKENLLSIKFLFSTNPNEQQAITKTLSSFDDKIELLREQNETLEKTAQTIFQEWFGQYSPERLEELPEGWRVGKFTDNAEILSGWTPSTSVSEYWKGNIPWFSVVDTPSNGIYVLNTEKHITELGVENSPAKILPIHTTIITARWTVGKLALTCIPLTINQSCFGLKSKSEINFYLYFLTKHVVSVLKSRVHGAVFDTITRDTFSSLDVVIPSIEKLQAFEEIVTGIFGKLKLNSEEILELATTRDTLLPKLMRGDMRVRV